MPTSVQYRCSQCHQTISAEVEPQRCPNCNAEAGIEPEHGVPGAMKAFGLLLGIVTLVSVAGGVLSRLAG
jgi:hypothetical protein